MSQLLFIPPSINFSFNNSLLELLNRLIITKRKKYYIYSNMWLTQVWKKELIEKLCIKSILYQDIKRIYSNETLQKEKW